MVYEVETIKRQAKLRSVGHGSACERRLSLWPMPYASLACDMTSASEVAVAAWGSLQVLYAFAFALRLTLLQFVAVVNVWCAARYVMTWNAFNNATRYISPAKWI